MLYNNPMLAHRMAKERMNDALREAKRARSAWAVHRPKPVRRWKLNVALILSSLLAIFARPQR